MFKVDTSRRNGAAGEVGYAFPRPPKSENKWQYLQWDFTGNRQQICGRRDSLQSEELDQDRFVFRT